MLKHLLPIVLLSVIIGCNPPSQAVTEVFEVYPEQASRISNDSNSARLYLLAYIGSNGCSSFKEFRREVRNDTLHLRMFGQRTIDPDQFCTMALVYYDDTASVSLAGGLRHIKLSMRGGRDSTISLN